MNQLKNYLLKDLCNIVNEFLMPNIQEVKNKYIMLMFSLKRKFDFHGTKIDDAIWRRIRVIPEPEQEPILYYNSYMCTFGELNVSTYGLARLRGKFLYQKKNQIKGISLKSIYEKTRKYEKPLQLKQINKNAIRQIHKHHYATR